MEEDFKSEMLEYYMSIGAISIEAIDENGEILYEITEHAKDVAPELWAAHTEYVDETLLDLYSKELIEIEYNENLEAIIHLSEEGYKIALEKGVIPPEGYQGI